MSQILRLNPADDVAIALTELAAGTAVEPGLRAAAAIPEGHKLAVRAVAAGRPVRRYGQVIGLAARDIAPGDWVHEHNLAMTDQPRDAEVGADANPLPAPAARATFEGFRRPDGRVGTRNMIGVLTSVNCSATVARRIADAFPGDQVAALTHTAGCGAASSGGDTALLQRTLAGYARHPNFAAVVMVGLGCEANQIPDWMAREGLTPGDRLHSFTIQEAGGTAKAIEQGRGLVGELLTDAARARRETVGADQLVVGLQCGGSDGWSGITANPALGAAVDRLIAQGGAAMLSETPEIYGAEHLLLRRAASAQVAEALLDRIAWWRAYADRHGMSLDNNPSPGNRKGGLTTILEKSLGAVAKSGSSPLVDVIGYAEPLRRPGLSFMDSPGYDPCSATGQIASGATLIVFTTGRGSVFGSRPAPTLKLATNARLAAWMADDVDIDCSPVLAGTSLSDMGELIFARMLAVASGQSTASETLGIGENEFVPWQSGAYL
ncbi:MAG TPA: altronate dehydratase family protein [Caulobacter sp.]|nr:altronate dehydratase family protein [Caulobacter sp.]